MLNLTKISKRYGNRWILRDVSADFNDASISILSGPNGSGKTTLLKIMAGLAKPTSGTVTGSHEPAKMAYVAHATFLYPGLTAEENLAFWSRCYRLALSEEDILLLLEKVGLADFAFDSPRTFSRGMCQRLNLARALMINPSLLLLDEPMTGLDSSSRDFFRKELVLLRERGVCIIVISHDLAEDISLADNLFRLEKGTLLSEEVRACGQ